MTIKILAKKTKFHSKIFKTQNIKCTLSKALSTNKTKNWNTPILFAHGENSITFFYLGHKMIKWFKMIILNTQEKERIGKLKKRKDCIGYIIRDCIQK